MQSQSELHADAISVCRYSRSQALMKITNHTAFMLILMFVMSANVAADENLNNTTSIENKRDAEQQIILNDWSATMAISINQKMAQQIQVKMLEIIVQVEETRLLDTQTRQFADKNRVGSQPTVGHAEPDFLKSE